MDKRQLGKLILRQRKDLIFWVVMLFNTLTAFATPAVDWYFPLKLVLLLWVGSGVWLALPVIERLKKRKRAWQLAAAALVLGVLYLFPAAWPLKVEYPLLELWFLVMVPCTWYSLWHFYGKRRMLRPRGILWTLWPVLQTAGALWAVADPDRGALGAAFLQQMFYLALGVEYARCGARYQHRILFNGGLGLITAAFWSCLTSFQFVLPEPAYPVLWAAALGVMNWILPELARGKSAE
ncbi:hypothetical protein [Acidaminococcus fermentans]|uniref:hypothetical protein n=1 Tax=Acidaminococcus fermentans TaxID=905 RepID=UPI00265DBC86|nr:hypothetical protein [Acidaminococcus fermentans]